MESCFIDTTEGRGRRPRPLVLSIASEYMGMVLACPYLPMEAQIFQANLSFFKELGPSTTTLYTRKVA